MKAKRILSIALIAAFAHAGSMQARREEIPEEVVTAKINRPFVEALNTRLTDLDGRFDKVIEEQLLDPKTIPDLDLQFLFGSKAEIPTGLKRDAEIRAIKKAGLFKLKKYTENFKPGATALGRDAGSFRCKINILENKIYDWMLKKIHAWLTTAKEIAADLEEMSGLDEYFSTTTKIISRIDTIKRYLENIRELSDVLGFDAYLTANAIRAVVYKEKEEEKATIYPSLRTTGKALLAALHAHMTKAIRRIKVGKTREAREGAGKVAEYTANSLFNDPDNIAEGKVLYYIKDLGLITENINKYNTGVYAEEDSTLIPDVPEESDKIDVHSAVIKKPRSRRRQPVFAEVSPGVGYGGRAQRDIRLHKRAK